MTKQSADENVQYESRYPLSNDPNDPNKAPNRKRYIVNGRVQCSACKKWKLVEEFHKAKNLTFGICGICKECARARVKAHYLKQKENSKYRDEDGNLTLSRARFRRKYERKEKYENLIERLGRKGEEECTNCTVSFGIVVGWEMLRVCLLQKKPM